MKLMFLGTAAAEGIPALWCNCDLCKKAWTTGGKDIRHRTAYLLDDDTVIDLGPDFYSQSLSYGIDTSKIQRVILTHPHMDHLAAQEFCFRLNGYSVVSGNLDFVASPEAVIHLTKETGQESAEMKYTPCRLIPGEWISSGDLEVMGVPASHAPGLGAMVLVIRRGGKTLLVAHDTGYLTEASWQMLKGIEMSAIVLEATSGFKYAETQSSHLGVNGTLRFRDRLAEIGCITASTQQYVTHFSHNGGSLQETLEAFFVPKGIKVAYDGLTVDI